jgi:hypothetical protein
MTPVFDLPNTSFNSTNQAFFDRLKRGNGRAVVVVVRSLILEEVDEDDNHNQSDIQQ